MKTPARETDAAGKEILIVEDSPTQAHKLQLMLSKYGFTVFIARDGAEAMQCVEERLPALVISDVMMPGMDGFEICKRIRENPRTSAVPVILLTTLSDPLDVINGLKCGADNLITKPWEENRLLKQIHYIFDNLKQRVEEQNEVEVEVVLGDERHLIRSGPVRLVSFLFHSYETAIEKNRELTKARDELRHLSTHDSLTGLYNRTFFEEELQRLALGRKFPVSILTADVDGLKKVNDRLGHAAGDHLIRLSAEVLAGSFRAGDVVARIGGDEFGVLLPEADAQVVAESMARVRRRIDEVNQAAPFTVSISLGAATARHAGELSEAMKESDRRMYQEKFSRSNPPPSTKASTRAPLTGEPTP